MGASPECSSPKFKAGRGEVSVQPFQPPVLVADSSEATSLELAGRRDGNSGPCRPAVGRGEPVLLFSPDHMSPGHRCRWRGHCGCCPRCSPEALRWAISRPCFSVGLDLGDSWSSILLNCTGQPLSLSVRVIPEIGEEHEEDGAIHPDEVDNERVLVVAAGHEVVLADVQGDEDKLDLDRARQGSERVGGRRRDTEKLSGRMV